MKFTFPVLLLVSSFASASEPTFERNVEPILTRYGCNSGGCHGKARGQNGFALSLLGFDTDFDYNAIVTEARGRRLFAADVDFSLFLRKACGDVPHGGGRKLPKDSPEYALLRAWIVAGTPRTPKDAPTLAKITVSPTEKLLTFNTALPLRVMAHFSDGSSEDVTKLAAFQSNDSGYAAVDATGTIKTGPIAGEAAVTARYADKFAVSNVLIPLPGTVNAKLYEKLPRQNFIDGHAWNKLKQLGLTPSEQATDATFLRRAFLDIIGRLPTPDETRAFLKDADAKKREKLIDALLARPEYADFWANKWADLLRPNPYHVGIKATFNLDSWLRDVFRKNMPYDQFVREILTASGSTFKDGATVFYRNRREPEELAPMVSQLFLGVRLDCAKCHQHPSEKWSQRDFYSFAAFFGRIGRKGTGISAPISGSEEIIFASESPATGKRRGGPVKHPLTGEEMTPTPLLGSPMEIAPEDDPRVKLAEWVTAKENPFFAKVIVNRVWADLMTRGLVDPVDDLRDTNPPSNPALLNELAADFRANGHDLKKLIRRIATSYVYGLSSTPQDRNVGDTRNYSRHYRQRLRAEVLLDAVTDITGVTEKFDAMSPGSRAMEAWTVRGTSQFLDSFGRPDPNQDPPCERTTDTTVVQALHLMNAPSLSRKITADDGRAAKLAASKLTSAEVVEELYLLAYCRPPTDAEKAACVSRFEKTGAKRREAVEDLMWGLLNTPEFVFGD
ncbi:DUF1549 and DUF1553 domain-containing protein [Limnoglobus roseus]|uniref:S-layer protein n=1 Tax=Limnoglobus roseus TaxID=2598579 RepID=A0A5C1AG88_9BACT|nr:DUF1549 and DUF1553 domain-containing protein [Limnoglobus roseus]QEL17253.1 hypothetical protein PX52LOC_04236 [Limnoglobus roseus]